VAWLILGERPSRRRLLGLALILAGIAAIGWTSLTGSAPGAWRGDLCFLAAVSCWSVYTVLARKWHVSPLEATVAVSVFGAATYLPIYALLLPSRLPAIPPGQVLWQGLFHGVLAVVVAMFAFTRTLRAFGPTRTTLITAVVPGAAALAAIPVLGEPLTLLAGAGVAAVTAGMIVGVSAPSPARRDAG
jgi:drug/metabolite transporter (DMT)-like permease